MKKNLLQHLFYKTVIIVLLVFGFNQLFARSPDINFEPERSFSEVTVNDFESTRIKFAFEGLYYIHVETREGMFTELIMPRGYSVGDLGTPKLPASKKLIEIPFGAEVSVKVKSYTTEEYRLSDFGIEHPLMPVQPSLRKDQNIDEVPFRYRADHYGKTGFIEPGLASVEILGVMRGQRLGRLTVAPVHYNPTEGTIMVYNNIVVEIQYTGADKALTHYIKASTYSPYFDAVYNQVINPFDTRDIFEDYPDLTKYPIKMVIVSHPDFKESLQPFIEWKTIIGFKIIEAYTDEIGNTAAAIKNFIHEQYHEGTPEDPAPTFVIVAGDPGKLPASGIGGASEQVTDLYYASVDGDYFPDMYIGRLSARNVPELQNQLDKILYYQKYEFDDPSFLNDVTLIAGADHLSWNTKIGQPTVQYGTNYYFNTANGFVNVNAYLANYAGCYDEERISVSLINYTAHCSPTSWSNPSLTVSNIHNMTNTGKYPLAIGNCCMSALFSHSECIGEAWVRAKDKGAVAYIGSAPNTHWFEDFYWSVGAFPIEGQNNGYVPDTVETTLGAYDAPFVSDYRAIASLKFVGNLAITEAHLQGYPTHSNVQWYWEGYHTFGDPSTIIYLTEGDENTVEHMDYLPAGVDLFTVNANPGSYVGISKDGVLHGAALVDESGQADVPIDPLQDEGYATIAVTKPQYIPYVQEIPVKGYNTVTFDIKDKNGDEITGAVVTFDGQTNDPGDYIFKNIEEGDYEYKVEKEGYFTKESEVTVEDDTTVDVTMIGAYVVTFEIEDKDGNEIPDAVITFDGNTYDPGNYVFKELEAGTYEYVVEKNGYFTFENEIVVEEDVTVNIKLARAYIITFEVEDVKGDEITGAVITFDGVEYEPDEYIFEDIEGGTYDYKVEKKGFFTVENEITVKSNVFVKVIMEFDDTYVDMVTDAELSVFPNPARNKFTVRSNEMIKQIRLFDISGQTVKDITVNELSSEIKISNLNTGIYVMQIRTAGNVMTKRVRIVR